MGARDRKFDDAELKDITSVFQTLCQKLGIAGYMTDERDELASFVIDMALHSEWHDADSLYEACAPKIRRGDAAVSGTTVPRRSN